MTEDLVFRVLFIIIYAGFAGVRIYYRRKAGQSRQKETEKPAEKKPPRTWAHALIFISILGMFIAIFLYLLIPPWMLCCSLPFPSFIRWIGVVLGLISILFLIWVHRTLGRFWSAELEIQAEHRLIIIGPYSRIRHPMYTVFILFTLGTMLIAATLFVFIFGLLVIISLYPISRQEEQLLLSQFGDQYQEYINRTGRFFPRLRQLKNHETTVRKKTELK